MKKRIVLTLLLIAGIIGLSIWGVNYYINTNMENQKKAARFDEYMSKSFAFLLDKQASMLIVTKVYEDAANEARFASSSDYKETFEECFYKRLRQEPIEKAFVNAVYEKVFVSTHVCMTMCNSAGPLRKEECSAFSRFINFWVAFDSIREIDNYDDFMKELNHYKSFLNTIMPIMSKSIQYYDKDINAWQNIMPNFNN